MEIVRGGAKILHRHTDTHTQTHTQTHTHRHTHTDTHTPAAYLMSFFFQKRNKTKNDHMGMLWEDVDSSLSTLIHKALAMLMTHHQLFCSRAEAIVI